jgi:glycosyltransferase involved in cell wall biosynthesis
MKISAIVPCYNSSENVEETLNSIMGQTYNNIEIIVINDGSNERSSLFLKSLIKKQTQPIHFIEQDNVGRSATFNRGVAVATGELIAIIGHDDIWDRTLIEKLVNRLKAEDESIIGVSSSYVSINESGKVFNDKNSYSRNEDKLNNFDNFFYHNHFFSTPFSIIKKQKILDLDGFDENSYAEDYDLYLRLTKNGDKLLTIADKLGQYRVLSQSASSDFDLMYASTLRSIKKFPNYAGFDKSICILKCKYSGFSKNVTFSELLGCTFKLGLNKLVFKAFLRLIIPKKQYNKLKNTFTKS